MVTYASYEFYTKYAGKTKKIPEEDFEYWSNRASSEIRRLTFGRIDLLSDIPDYVQMCCCEVANKLYLHESIKDESGKILQSYSNDGESGTYLVSELTESALEKEIYKTIYKHLSLTGLMYAGV